MAEIVVLDTKAHNTLNTIIEFDEYPHTLVLTRKFAPSKECLRTLAHMLAMVTCVVYITGEVTRRTWRKVSRVLHTVVQYREEGLGVELRTVDFVFSEKKKRRYFEHLDRVSIAGIHKIWIIEPYSSEK